MGKLTEIYHSKGFCAGWNRTNVGLFASVNGLVDAQVPKYFKRFAAKGAGMLTASGVNVLLMATSSGTGSKTLSALAAQVGPFTSVSPCMRRH